MKYLVINAKNYLEVSGSGLEKLTIAIEDVAGKPIFNEVKFYLAPPGFGLGSSIKARSNFSVLAQHLDLATMGASTGFSIPEIAKSFGAVGSLINHSEHRIALDDIDRLVSRLRQLGMIDRVCQR